MANRKNIQRSMSSFLYRMRECGCCELCGVQSSFGRKIKFPSRMKKAKNPKKSLRNHKS